jgi:phage shock protein PspC (stress-responsive transcriptional regulator)
MTDQTPDPNRPQDPHRPPASGDDRHGEDPVSGGDEETTRRMSAGDPLAGGDDSVRADDPIGGEDSVRADDPFGGDEAGASWQAAGPRKLTRSRQDSVIGGVAGGLGRYFGIDPILFRIGFAALTFAGGIGVVAYLALLAFVPPDGPEPATRGSRAVAIGGAVLLGLALLASLDGPIFFFGPGLFVLALIGVAGVLLWRALGGGAGAGPGRTAGQIALAAGLAVLVACTAVGVGLAAALGGGVVIAVMAVIAGLVLAATAFVGGARWLILPALALVVPLGLVAAADIDFDGGIGEREYRPASVSELTDGYRIGLGTVNVDLRDLDLPDGRTDLDLDVGVGEAVVYVPEEACITSDVEIGAGAADVLDREHDGVDVVFAENRTAPSDRPHLHIDAEIGLGVIEVVREGHMRDGFDRDGFGRDRFQFSGEAIDGGFEGGTNCA